MTARLARPMPTEQTGHLRLILMGRVRARRVPQPAFRALKRKQGCRLLNVRRDVSRVVHASTTVTGARSHEAPHDDGDQRTQYGVYDIVIASEYSGGRD